MYFLLVISVEDAMWNELVMMTDRNDWRLFPCCSDTLETEENAAAVSPQKQRTRSVSSTASYAQMTAVFNDLAPSSKKFQLHGTTPAVDSSESVTVVHAVDESATASSVCGGEIGDMLAALNVAALHNLGGGDVLLEVCDTALVYLHRYRVIYEEDLASATGQDMKLPTSLSDVLSVRMRCINSSSLKFFRQFCGF